MGIRILDYFDDWLVSAQSEAELLYHRSLLLSHLECLELRVNFVKSSLLLSQWIIFLGAVLGSARTRAVVAPEHALAIRQLAASFTIGVSLPSQVSEDAGPHGATAEPLERPSVVRAGCDSGNGLQKEGCLDRCVKGALCKGKPTLGPCSKEKTQLCINCLEKLAVCQALCTFLPDLRGHLVLFCSDNMTVVFYINNLSQSNACAGQTEPKGRHAVSEQGLLRGVDAPSTNGS